MTTKIYCDICSKEIDNKRFEGCHPLWISKEFKVFPEIEDICEGCYNKLNKIIKDFRQKIEEQKE